MISSHRRFALSTAVTGALVSTLFAASTAMAADPVKIGIVQPLSGPASLSGNNSLNGARLAVDAINEAGGIIRTG